MTFIKCVPLLLQLVALIHEYIGNERPEVEKVIVMALRLLLPGIQILTVTPNHPQ